MQAIVIENFHKGFGSRKAVRGVSFSVKPGELFGLIGPDGAGKTTLIRAICTLLVPDQGRILVNGFDVTYHIAEIRALLGYMPQRFSLYPDLSVQQNLLFFADLFQVPPRQREERLQRLYRFSRLSPFKKRKAADLSGGMKQKLALSCALIHTPEILILDEPTLGVDPGSRQEFWDILHTLRRQGTTVLVSTAYMDEAEQCDRVALMFQGRVVGLDPPELLKRNYPFPIYTVRGDNLRSLRDFFSSLSVLHSIQVFGDSLHVSFTKEPDSGTWQEWQRRAGGNLHSWKKHPPSIEDVFLELMGKSP